MASNYTSNYSLCQWAADDKVLRAEFNADNAKIDAALAGKASTPALTELQNTLDGKITGLQSTAASQGAALALRNCRFAAGSYTGTDKYGASNANSLTFPQKPVFLCVVGESSTMVMHLIRGQELAVVSSGSATGKLSVAWGSKSVSWYVQEPIGTYVGSGCQMNANTTYHYFAILEL